MTNQLINNKLFRSITGAVIAGGITFTIQKRISNTTQIPSNKEGLDWKKLLPLASATSGGIIGAFSPQNFCLSGLVFPAILGGTFGVMSHYSDRNSNQISDLKSSTEDSSILKALNSIINVNVVNGKKELIVNPNGQYHGNEADFRGDDDFLDILNNSNKRVPALQDFKNAMVDALTNEKDGDKKLQAEINKIFKCDAKNQHLEYTDKFFDKIKMLHENLDCDSLRDISQYSFNNIRDNSPLKPYAGLMLNLNQWQDLGNFKSEIIKLLSSH